MQTSQYDALGRVEATENIDQPADSLNGVGLGKDGGDLVKPARAAQVIEDRLTQRIATAELRVHRHPGYRCAGRNGFDSEVLTTHQLIARGGQDALSRRLGGLGATGLAVWTLLHDLHVQCTPCKLKIYSVYRLQGEIMDEDLSGRVAIVTGGSRGIGATAAHRLAAAGAAVVVSGRDHRAIEEVARSITDACGQALGLAADVTSGAALERLREEAEAALGPADILLAFAGGGGNPQTFETTTEQQWRQAIDTNLTSTFLTLRTFVPGMMERHRGAVVTMASTAGRQPGGASLAYGAAKAGVVMLTRQLAQEVGPSGVRINCLAPSTIVTERIEQLMPADQRDRLAAQFPLRRLGSPNDVAEAVLFLVSESSGWITGVTLDITGGRVTG